MSFLILYLKYGSLQALIKRLNYTYTKLCKVVIYFFSD